MIDYAKLSRADSAKEEARRDLQASWTDEKLHDVHRGPPSAYAAAVRRPTSYQDPNVVKQRGLAVYVIDKRVKAFQAEQVDDCFTFAEGTNDCCCVWSSV